MKILVLYQNIQSGAKVATESIVAAYRATHPTDTLITYKQQAYVFTGPFSFIRNTLWSMWDYYKILQTTQGVDLIFATLYTFAIPWRVSRNRTTPAIFQIHGDQRFKPYHEKAWALQRAYRSVVGIFISWLQFVAMQNATRIAFVSPVIQRKFLQDIRTLRTVKKTFIMPNGVDLNHFTPINKRQKNSLRSHYRCPTNIHIGYIGRIDYKKGIHNLILSLSHITPSLTVWVVYPAPVDDYSRKYLASLQLLASRSPSQHIIKFIQNPKHIIDYYHIIDYLVLPSQQEMLPLVVLEGLACGVLTVATGVGGTKDILMQISEELILLSSNATDIASRLQGLMVMTPSKRTMLIARGHEVAKHYSWNNSADILWREGNRITQR